MSSEPVALTLVGPSDAELLANLLELYIHDLSDVFAHPELGPNGRFGYPYLPLYFSEPDRRIACLIRQGSRALGFILVTRGSPVLEDVDVHDVAEFFVVRRYRRSGVGRQAAMLLWRQFPGKWSVRVSEGNPRALAFWTQVVAEYTAGDASESLRPGDPHAWRVFYFEKS
ncbi:MAG TPA: GNAT family N-acetyltransferase [Polyangiaceae bacterium]|nr:GNAT family N-acetyltransferase [Polyangiaceae bacterium]